MMDTSERVKVRVISISKISPSPSNDPIPTRLNLSFFDTLWVFVSPIQKLYFYNTNSSFETLSLSLKKSLSFALKHFYPLSGKLVYSPESGELEIDFTDSSGVEYLEAESDYDLFKLVGDDDVHDVAAFQALVPKLDITELPAALLSVQVTRFAGGGVVVGVSAHHVAVDGMSFCQMFMKSWAEMCRNAEGGGEFVGSTLCYDRSSIIMKFDHQGVSKHFLNRLAPRLPKLGIAGLQKKISSHLTRRTFFLNSKNIQQLKEQPFRNNNHGAVPISKFVATSTHVWLCTTKARDVDGNNETNLIFAMDCRSRLDPPIGEGYFGNCIRPCIVKAKACELMGEDGFTFAATTIKSAIDVVCEEPLKECMNWADLYMGLPSELLFVGGSPRFQVYETDFGWRRPSRVESVSLNRDGVVILTDASEDGAVQVSIALSPPHMNKFASLFLDGM